MKEETRMKISCSSEHQVHPGGYFLLLLLVASLYAAYLVLSPYLNTIIISAALALLFYPMHSRILRFTGGRQTLACLCTCGVIICLVILPLFFLATALVAQGVHSFNSIYEWVQGGGLVQLLAAEPVAHVRIKLTRYLSFIDLSKIDLQGNLLSFSKSMGQFLLSKSSNIVSNLTRLALHFFLLVFSLFYLLKEGRVMLDRLLHLLPLTKVQENELIQRIVKVIRLTFVGAVCSALVQGIAGGIALAIVGFPALFWGTVMAFASLIPVVGTALIWVPAAVYLGFSAGWGLTIFFVLWNLLMVGSIDNFLRPYLIGGEAGLSPLVIFFAILGGVQLFGFIGILYGPLILALCGVLLYLYELEHKDYLNALDQS
jgi:predicted PurR-regulated permease PerM